jgi:hypothetical protein
LLDSFDIRVEGAFFADLTEAWAIYAVAPDGTGAVSYTKHGFIVQEKLFTANRDLAATFASAVSAGDSIVDSGLVPIEIDVSQPLGSFREAKVGFIELAISPTAFVGSEDFTTLDGETGNYVTAYPDSPSRDFSHIGPGWTTLSSTGIVNFGGSTHRLSFYGTSAKWVIFS